MDKLIQYINSKTNNSFADVKITNVVFNKENQIATFKFIYKKERNTITDKERELLQSLIKEFLSLQLVVDVKTKKALIDEDVVKEFVYKFICSSYSSISVGFSKNNISVQLLDQQVSITISFLETYINFLKNKNFENELVSYLEQNFFESFSVQIKPLIDGGNIENALQQHIEKIEQNIYVVEEKPQFVVVQNVTSIIGEAVQEKPLFLESVKSPVVGVAVSGNIRYITKRSFTSKKKNENGEFVQKDYFSFSLVNGRNTLPCVLFLSQDDIIKLEQLTENAYVVAFGDAEKYNDRLNFKVKRLSACEPVQESVAEQVPLKQEAEAYINVIPQPHTMVEQANLFDLNATAVNEFLAQNDVVVFDFETTGLEATVNEIIEIGAVKIHQGKITETFSTLIKPKAEITEEITEITGITNEMVANAISIEQALPDFYKFTRNSVLSAYNISFDYSFLYVVAKKMGYVFDNRQIDTMYLAKTKVHGLKNYRLKSVATQLGVQLENAHRAVNDALATAEVFILLSDGLK